MKDGNIPLQQPLTKDRQQRAALILKDVAYVIEAHFELTKKATAEDALIM